MHEAALAENILQIAQETAAASHAHKISAIGLKLGEMSGVEVEALNFSFDVLKKNTPAAEAELKITRVPIRAKCNKCGKTFTVAHYNFFCPECDGILILQSGRELLVEFVDCE
ncbi:MAG: hydrogenase maturation nickel metallochaperone HypA [Selenomonadaceae bacterium]|nr:hydrogenase maturation nickel metallochaperone HypA [Selenomonadaceae bacterium]